MSTDEPRRTTLPADARGDRHGVRGDPGRGEVERQRRIVGEGDKPPRVEIPVVDAEAIGWELPA
ncbi:hypothetical protein [Aeoliella sp.]|uniref:hypothetical protein n=1 Tax=Aeoliella sp. TaxID=2795800 RepID=UPI003CCC1C81